MGADPTTDAIDSGIDSGSDSSGSVSSGSRPSSLTEDEAEDLDGAACQNDRDGTECPENDSYRTECQNDGTECQEKDRGNTEGQEKDRDGCDHYRRKARLVAPCCNKVYTCRFCHNDEEDHAMKRHMVEEMICSYCDHRQPVQQDCANCHRRLGKYYCKVCRLHDDEEKQQFHCELCGICRSGGRTNFFHCPNCDLCLPNTMKDNHKCVQGVGHSDCGVCLEDMHSSRSGGQVLPCGHILHVTCYREMLKHRIRTCPKCKVSIKNREREWARMDAEIRRSVVPAEFRRSFMEALCCDCHATTRTKYHIIGLKCGKCGSYNTVPAGPLERRPHSGLSSLLLNSMRRLMARAQ